MEINYAERAPHPVWKVLNDFFARDPVIFNSALTTRPYFIQATSPLAGHGCSLQIDSLWEIIKTRCSFLKRRSLHDLCRAARPPTEWITHQIYCPAQQQSKCFLFTWIAICINKQQHYSFLLSEQWNRCSIFPLAQSTMIYQCAHTGWATRGSRAFRLFSATNNLLWKQKESKTEGHCRRIFVFQHTFSGGFPLWQLNSFSFSLMLNKNCYLRSSELSLTRKTISCTTSCKSVCVHPVMGKKNVNTPLVLQFLCYDILKSSGLFQNLKLFEFDRRCTTDSPLSF